MSFSLSALAGWPALASSSCFWRSPALSLWSEALLIWEDIWLMSFSLSAAFVFRRCLSNFWQRARRTRTEKALSEEPEAPEST